MSDITKNILSSPHTPEWAELFSTIRDRYERHKLKRFFAYCSACGLRPEDVTDRVLAAFEAAVREADVSRPFQVMRDAGLAWNRQMLQRAGWPQITLTVPFSERWNRVSMTTDQFTESFARDIEGFLSQRSEDSLFAENPLTPMSAATKYDRKGKILQLATRAVVCGRDPASIKTLSDLVEPATAKLVLAALWRDAGEEPNGHYANLCRLMVTIAKFWAHLPDDQVDVLKKVEKRFRPPKTGMTMKNRSRLRQFTDDENVRRLVGLPSKVVEALDIKQTRISDAVRVQQALAVALLLVAPVRVKNLASIDIEEHIHRVSETICSLVFPDVEVKNRQDLEYPLPVPVLQLLDLYLEVYRPLLAKKRGSKLFVSLNGVEKEPAYLSAQIPKFIKAELGFEMNLHLFRHFAGFIYLKSHPGDYETVRQLLGHKSIKTTVEFYTGLEHIESFRRYDDILDRYRDEGGYGSC